MGYIVKFAEAGFVALCAMSMNVTLAQTPPNQAPPTQTPPPATTVTYKSLLDQGFELKTTMLLSDAASTRLVQIVQPETVIVTLQKGAVTATCWLTLGSWNLHNISGVACNTLK
jgi:hypothetical protein